MTLKNNMELKNLFTPGAQQFWSQLSWIARKVTKPLATPIQQATEQFNQQVQPAVQWIQDTVNTSFVDPVMKPVKRNEKIWKVNKFFNEKWITIEHIKAMAEDEWLDPDEVVSKFQSLWLQVEWMESIEDIQAKEQEKVWEDLWIMGNIWEGVIGAFRAWEQIPRIAGAGMGYLTQNVTWPLIAGGLDLVWADTMADKWRAASKKTGEWFKNIWEDITRAWEWDITEKQRTARRFWGEMALTAPIGWGYLAWSKGALWLAGRSGVVWAGFWAAQPIIDKGWEATLWDIATGGIIWGWVGAVAWPLIGKVIAPAIWGIVSKTGKYGEALIKWGVEWAKKSISRDISALKAPWIETVTRNIPKKVVSSNLWFTPTQRAKIEKITGKDEATYLLEKWLAGKGKEELAEIFMKQSDDMYHGITNQLAGVKEKVQAPVAKEALLDIMEQLESSPKIARAYAKDIQWVKDMLARDEFTLSELNNIRRAYDKVNTGMFTVQGKARSGLENAIDVKVRQDLSSQLQKEAKKFWVDVKQMNTELRAWIEMKDALLSRLSQEEKNNFIGLQDLWVSAILSGGNPVTALATIWVKKYAEKIAPWIAQKAYNLNKAPNVTRTVSRGNTITSSNKSSRLGLASNPRDTVVSDGVTPIFMATKNKSK